MLITQKFRVPNRFFPAALSVAALACSVVLAGCGVVAKGLEQASEATQHVGSIGRYGKLTPKETLWAKVAWRYFQNNTNTGIGLVNGSDKQPIFTIWQAGDYLAAVVSARELGLIEEQEFDTRVSYLLGFLATMDLADDKLPNKAYSAATGKMVNFSSQPDNIGWSAVDIGRLLMWMKITGQRHPKFQEYLDKVALRWNYCDVINNCGQLSGRYRNKGETSKYQEGRLGYEQLAGAGFAVWGFNSSLSGNVPATETTTILGLPVQYDARDARTTGVQTPVLTMPHVFMGMELGWRNPAADRFGQRADTPSLEQLADQVYRVQEARYLKERVFTARSDYQVPAEPYQVFNSVFAAGYPWNTIDSDGKEYPRLSLVSTRAAFGMWVLWPTPYTNQLIEVVESMYDKDRGWFEGRIEATGAPQQNITLATNAAVLEALLFKVKGRLYSPEPAPGYFQVQLADVFLRLNRCYPSERPVCEAKPAEGRPGIAPLLIK